MRLQFTLSPSTSTVTFSYPYLLSGVLHKWLGLNNPWHDALSLYSFGWLGGGRLTPQHALDFPDGASWFISGWESEFLQKLLSGSVHDVEVIAGMRVKNIQIVEPPRFRSPHVFRVSGPVLLKVPLPEGKVHFSTFKDGAEADHALTHSIHRKMEEAGLKHLTDGVQLRFLSNHRGAKTKLVQIKNIFNRASACPVEATGSPEALRFMWLTGVGHSTGVGFGGLC